jgi:hypothetical protein
MGKLDLAVNFINKAFSYCKNPKKLGINANSTDFIGLKLAPQLAQDTVQISTAVKPVIDITKIYEEMSKLGIKELRRIDTKTFRGETLEGKPEILQKLKDFGFKIVVDFRNEAGEGYKQACQNAGLEYFKFPLSHTQNFAAETKIDEEFVKNLKKLFEICDNGDAYMACRWGIDRTNVGVIMNYLLNPTPHLVPEIVEWGSNTSKSIINKNRKNAENILKSLTEQQKEYLGLDGMSKEVLRRRAMKLTDKNKIW